MITLLVDDDPTLREVLRQAFELEDMPIGVTDDPHDILRRVGRDFAGVVITDVRMPDMDGLDLFRRIHAIDPDLPVIVMTGHGDVPMVIDAMRQGVFDFIPKPFAADHLIASTRRATEMRALVLENRALRATPVDDSDSPLIGESPDIVQLRDTIRQLAQADVDVLIEGETGTGKELVAHLLHRLGPRRGKPFVAVNCASLPPGLAEPELFGHAPGVLTQFRWGQVGRIEESSGGTLFLDEAASMPLSVQGTLLRVIEEREVLAIGAERPKQIDLRVIATTNTDLSEQVARNAFRKDLFYRLNSVQLRIPPLRDRRADVPLLFAFFIDEASQRLGRPVPAFDRAVHVHLHNHDWPGNVRELRHYAQRVLLGLGSQARCFDQADLDLATQTAHFEASVIRHALTQTRGDVQASLMKLGLPRNTFYDKLKRYNIRASDYR